MPDLLLLITLILAGYLYYPVTGNNPAGLATSIPRYNMILPLKCVGNFAHLPCSFQGFAPWLPFMSLLAKVKQRA